MAAHLFGSDDIPGVGLKHKMIHKIFPVGPLQCNCSIVGDEQTYEAMVIDPGDQIDQILDILKQEKLKLTQIVITHAHIDHVGGAMKLKAATGAPILMNRDDQALLKMLDVQAQWIGMRPPGTVVVDESVADGHVLKIGTIPANVIHTPGHTEGSICLYIPDSCGGRYVVCRKHWTHRPARRIVR
jgi:hydroxyacylglutathione hydrolase